MRSTLILICLGLAACSGSERTLVDAGSDGGGHDAGIPFVAARHPPWPMVSRGSGPLLTSFRLVTVNAVDDPDAPALQAFDQELTTSPWWETVGREYGIPKASGATSLIGPPINAALSFKEIVAYLSDLAVDAGLTADAGPNGDRANLYILYLPADAGFSDYTYLCGYHSAFGDTSAPAEFLGRSAFAAVSRDPSCAASPGEDPLDWVTISASHELVEAATDPIPPSGYVVGVSPTTDPWLSSIWLSFEPPSPEVGDLCNWTQMQIPLDGGLVAVQRIWSNEAAADGGDPCVPAVSTAYYNTSAAQDWYAVPDGGSVDIPLLGWSTAPTTDWAVDAFVYESQNLYDAGVSVTTELGTQRFIDPTCQFDSAVINNGATGTISVTLPATARSGDYAVLVIESSQPSPTSCFLLPSLGDGVHLWYVGVYVP